MSQINIRVDNTLKPGTIYYYYTPSYLANCVQSGDGLGLLYGLNDPSNDVLYCTISIIQ